MALILGYRTDKFIGVLADCVRPVGMNNLMFIEHRYPTSKEKAAIKNRLKADEVCIVYDANNKPVECLSYFNYK